MFPGIIATAVLHGPAAWRLIDPGPSTTIENLRAALARKAIAIADVRQVLLTHIHLDHAGAAGLLVRENPGIEVLVHERGAPHMIDPAKLLASATRLYGEEGMERLWGAFLPVPAARVRALAGGERIVAAGRELDVAYTPGHASHHVSYSETASRIAFVGDTAGIRRRRQAANPRAAHYVMPPTPPPDIDLEAWAYQRGAHPGWEPDTLFLTHSAVPRPTVRTSIADGSPRLLEPNRRPLARQPGTRRCGTAAAVRRTKRSQICGGSWANATPNCTAGPDGSTTRGSLSRYWRNGRRLGRLVGVARPLE